MNLNSISDLYRKNNISSLNSGKASKNAAKASPSAEIKASVNEDRVEISSAASASAGVYDAGKISAPLAKEAAAVDNSAKIQELKEKIANGAYSVSSADVAEKMLTEMGY